MIQTDIKIVHSKNVTIINSSKNLVTFDHRAGYDYKPVICTFSFMLSESFVNDLLELVDVELGFPHYEVKSPNISLITLLPQKGYSNESLESSISNLMVKYNL